MCVCLVVRRCVCILERERERVCVYVRERERVYVCERETGTRGKESETYRKRRKETEIEK